MPVEGSSVIEVSKEWYQLGTKLRRLWLDFCKPAEDQIDISPLLDCCPFLTHLTITFPQSREPYLKYFEQDRHLQLQYLEIRTHMEMQDLLSLVRHCPELRYLRFNWDDSMDMKQILDACPSLKGVGVNTRFFSYDDPWWKDRRHVSIATRSSTTASLQELNLRVKSGDLYQQTATMLTQHCEHLKRLYLDIELRDGNGMSELNDLYYILVYNPLPALEEFQYHVGYPHAPAKAAFVIPLLKKCPNLKYVYIDTSHAGPIYRALVGLHLPYLRCLRVSDTDHVIYGLEELLFSIADTNTPLERFVFGGNVFGSHEIYQALAQILSLRHIELNDYGTRRPRDKKVMTQCLSRLRGDGVTSTPATRNLESIEFYNVEGFMTVDAFGSLRKILPLKRVAFYRCGPMSERGLRLLVDREPSLEFLAVHLSSRTTDGNSLEPLLAYARTKISIVNTPGP